MSGGGGGGDARGGEGGGFGMKKWNWKPVEKMRAKISMSKKLILGSTN
jgi:hypothetical protein